VQLNNDKEYRSRKDFFLHLPTKIFMRRFLQVIFFLVFSTGCFAQSDSTVDVAAVQKDGKWGYIDKSGKEIVPCKYDYIGDFLDGVAPVKINRKSGFVDIFGKEVIACKYDFIGKFYDVDVFDSSVGKHVTVMAKVRIGKRWGYIDKRGKEIIPIKFDYISMPSDKGYLKVQNEGKYGIIDITGKEITPCVYDYIDDLPF
jgi:WG containing repeat